MSKVLRVVKTEVKTSKKVADKMASQGRYKIVTVQTEATGIVKDAFGRTLSVKKPVKQSAFVAWIDSPIPGRETSDFGYDAEVGDLFAGDIVQREVEPYPIPSPNGDQIDDNGVRFRTVSTASVVVVGDSDDKEDWEMDILRAFRGRDFILKGKGDAGAPGGNLETARNRERTSMTGHDLRAGLPTAMAEADPGAIIDYANHSGTKNQDEASTNRS